MKIIVRLPNALGDMVMGVAFLSAVRNQYPGSDLHVILSKGLGDIKELLPFSVVIHEFDKKAHKGLAKLYRFGRKLRQEKFDLLFCLPNSISASVVCSAVKAKKSVGFYSPLNFLLFSHAYARPKGLHRVEEYISLLEKFSQQKTTQGDPKLVIKSDLPLKKKLVLINFNSEATSRRIPLDKGRALLQEMLVAFPTLEFGLIGAPKEFDYAERVRKGFEERVTNYAGKTTIYSLARLMKSSICMLSTDSGPAHLANALNLPLVVLFGAGDENNTAPFRKEQLQVLRLGKLGCEPCVKNTCMYGSPKCLELLENKFIINALTKYI